MWRMFAHRNVKADKEHLLTKDDLKAFKEALSAALRTTKHADEVFDNRFIELRPGTIASLRSPANHLLTGRRGVGKSTTLAIFQRRAEHENARVIFVDVQLHRSRQYPDVLIDIIVDILKEIQIHRWTWKREPRRFRRRAADLLEILHNLLDAASEVTVSMETEKARSTDSEVKLRTNVAKKFATIVARASNSRSSRTQRSEISTQTRSKQDYLRDLTPEISAVLEEGARANGRDDLFVILDDFYFITKEQQPLVLDYLHSMTKRSNVWLKIGSVRSRTHTYSEGDPPLGMQQSHDLHLLPLDIGLSEFATAKSFLEDVVNGVLDPTGLKIQEVMTPTARERAVLAVGGAVARDYFDLLIASADAAWESAQKRNEGATPLKIQAENIHTAAGLRLERKKDDLRSDAKRDVSRLEGRLADLVKFAHTHKTLYFLVKREDLDSEWGREVAELEDLRFVHRIATSRPNSAKWRGVDTVVFMMDLASLIKERLRGFPIIEFWKPGNKDALRKSKWIYEGTV